MSDEQKALAPPPPYVFPEDCFASWYLYLLDRHRRRPTLGELAQHSRLSHDQCKRLRLQYEARLRRLARTP